MENLKFSAIHSTFKIIFRDKTQCSHKGTEFLFNNLFINFAFIYLIIFVTSDYITLHPVPGVES